MKKIITLLLAAAITAAVFIGASVVVFAGRSGDTNGDGTIDNKDVVTLFRFVSGNKDGAVEENCDFNCDGEVNNKDVTALFRAVSSGNIPDVTEEETTEETQIDPPAEYDWDLTIQNAAALANGVQGKFTDANRKKFLLSNQKCSVLYDLTTRGAKKVEGIYNTEGKPYFESTDTYIVTPDGSEYKPSNSGDNGRMNSNRIGYYYYDFHFRDQTFEKSAGSSGNPLKLLYEHTFHTYSDKMHEELRIIATGEYSSGGVIETRTVIPASSVNSFIIKNAKGETSSLDGFDFSSVEYVAFDIKDAGIFGVIMPATDGNGYMRVEYKNGSYTVIRGIGMPHLDNGEYFKFGHRIYTSEEHEFDNFRVEAYIERNPLTDVSVGIVDNAKYLGYDALAGCYKFTTDAMEFYTAYYNTPNKHYRLKVRIKGDGLYDRKIYIQTAENNKGHGRLECAAILDENNCMLPISLEVGKNFDGENEEKIYYPETGSGAAAYGEVYAPIIVGKDEYKRFTMLHLYQNWGNYPLKQLSFIAFHIPYYHLSVGVSETNCITPYFVNGKDAWTLPDFRANSAELWDEGNGKKGTQHNSVGELFFLQYKDASGNSYKSESQHADIASAGPIYADITMDYLSDDGKIKATYRHVEMAQTDENRTYYNIKLEVLDDVTVKKFRDDFSFFSVNSRGAVFSKIGYLDENNNPAYVNSNSGFTSRTRYFKLGKEYPYFDYYKARNKNPSTTNPNEEEYDTVNFALIIKSSDITIGGNKYNGNFIFVDKYGYSLFSSPYGALNTASLSLDITDQVTLKKGDVLELEIILLPWGDYSNEDDTNVKNVRADSCIDPYKITVIEGEEYEDRFVPSVRAVNNKATFKISGGASTAAVRVYGFTDYKKPTVTFRADGKETNIKLSDVHDYDGYQVYLDDDGTYSYSFNVNMDAANEYEITVTQ